MPSDAGKKKRSRTEDRTDNEGNTNAEMALLHSSSFSPSLGSLSGGRHSECAGVIERSSSLICHLPLQQSGMSTVARKSAPASYLPVLCFGLLCCPLSRDRIGERRVLSLERRESQPANAWCARVDSHLLIKRLDASCPSVISTSSSSPPLCRSLDHGARYRQRGLPSEHKKRARSAPSESASRNALTAWLSLSLCL